MRTKFFVTFFMVIILGFNALAKQRPIKVLSLDGGGVRGMISLAMINEIEKELGKPASEIFDLIVGSSTGGITALALVTPDQHGKPKLSAQYLVDNYAENARRIFSYSWMHFIATAGGLLGPKYETDGIMEVIDLHVGSTMLSAAITPVIVTGYHVAGQGGVEFCSVHAHVHANERDCLMAEVGMATAAAPVFFDTVDVTFPWGTLEAVADGGLYKNNPALIAYINAKTLYPGHDIDVYSFGTGKISAEEIDQQLKGRGLLHWISPIIRHTMIGNSDADNTFLHKLLNEDGERNFFRLDIEVSRDHRAMDDTSDENFEYLYERGLAATETQTFRDILNRLRL